MSCNQDNAAEVVLESEFAGACHLVEELFGLCRVLDSLIPDQTRALNDVHGFLMRARSVAELASLAQEYRDPQRAEAPLNEIAGSASGLFHNCNQNIDAADPLPHSHPELYRRIESTVLSARGLLWQSGDAAVVITQLGERLARAARDGDHRRAHVVRELVQEHLAWNVHALLQRLTRTPFAASIGQLAMRTLELQGSGNGATREVCGELLRVGQELNRADVADPPRAPRTWMGNVAAFGLVEAALHAWRVRQPEHTKTLLRAAVDALPPTPEVVEVSNAIRTNTRIIGSLHELRTGERVFIMSRPLFDWVDLYAALRDCSEATDDSGRLEAIVKVGRTLTRLASSMPGFALPVAETLPRWTSFVLRQARALELIERAAGQQVAFVRHAAQLSQRSARALGAFMETETTFHAGVRAEAAGFTAFRRSLSVSSRLNILFSAVSAVEQATEVRAAWRRGDTHSAIYEGVGVGGSLLSILGCCMAGPAGVVVGLAGTAATLISQNPPPDPQYSIGEQLRSLLHQMGAQREHHVTADGSAPLPGNGALLAARIGVAERINALYIQMERIRDTWLVARSDEQYADVVERIRAVGLDPRTICVQGERSGSLSLGPVGDSAPRPRVPPKLRHD